MRPALRPIGGYEVWSRPAAATGVRLCYLDSVLEGSDTLELALDPAGSRVRLALASLNPKAGFVQRQRILRLSYVDGTFDEFRIATVEQTRDGDGAGRIEVTATSLFLMLGDTGLLRTTGVDGAPIYEGGVAELAPSAILSTVLLPWLASRGLDWIELGEVEIDDPLASFAWARTNATAFVLQLAAATRLEPVLRAVGETAYALDLRIRIGSTAPTVEIQPGTNLRAFAVTLDGDRQATVVEPFGAESGTIAHTAWTVVAADHVLRRYQLRDPLGGAGPVYADGALDGLHLVRASSGGVALIAGTTAGTHEVELAPGTPLELAIGERVTLRGAEGGSGDLVVRTAAGLTATAHQVRLTSVVGNVVGVELLDGTDALPASEPLRYLDRLATALTTIVDNRAPNAAAGAINWANGTGAITGGSALFAAAQVGDVVRVASPSTPWPLTVVGRSGSGTITLDLVHRRGPLAGQAVVFVGGGSGTSSLLRPTAAAPIRILDCDPTANTVKVTSAAGLAVGDVLETWYAGRPAALRALSDPALIASYGTKVVQLSRTDLDVRGSLTPNAFMEAWTGGDSAVPDGWVRSAGTATNARITDPAITQHGSASLRLTGTAGLRAPAGPMLEAGDRVSIRVAVRIDSLTAFTLPSGILVTLVCLDPSGATVLAEASVGLVEIIGSEGGTAGHGIWFDAAFAAIPCPARGRVAVRLTVPADITAIAWRVDAVTVSAGDAAPPFPRAEPGPEANRLYAAAEDVLARNGRGPVSVSIDLIDLHRQAPLSFASARLTMGAAVRLRHPTLPEPIEARCVAASIRPRHALTTQVTLDTEAASLTGLIAGRNA